MYAQSFFFVYVIKVQYLPKKVKRDIDTMLFIFTVCVCVCVNGCVWFIHENKQIPVCTPDPFQSEEIQWGEGGGGGGGSFFLLR